MGFFANLPKLRPESERVPHKDLLLGLKSLTLMLCRVMAASAPALSPTVPVIFKAFAIQL